MAQGKYKCRHCNLTYTPNPKEKEYSEETKKLPIKIYMEGNSGRAVGRILGVGKNTTLRWIRKYSNIPKKDQASKHVSIIEMDEAYTFSGEKKPNLRDHSFQSNPGCMGEQFAKQATSLRHYLPARRRKSKCFF